MLCNVGELFHNTLICSYYMLELCLPLPYLVLLSTSIFGPTLHFHIWSYSPLPYLVLLSTSIFDPTLHFHIWSYSPLPYLVLLPTSIFGPTPHFHIWSYSPLPYLVALDAVSASPAHPGTSSCGSGLSLLWLPQ